MKKRLTLQSKQPELISPDALYYFNKFVDLKEYLDDLEHDVYNVWKLRDELATMEAQRDHWKRECEKAIHELEMSIRS